VEGQAVRDIELASDDDLLVGDAVAVAIRQRHDAPLPRLGYVEVASRADSQEARAGQDGEEADGETRRQIDLPVASAETIARHGGPQRIRDQQRRWRNGRSAPPSGVASGVGALP
jgi:hypothetical protein